MCTPAYQIVNDGVIKYCREPCTSPSLYYNLLDGSCQDSCVFPLASYLDQNIKVCDRICAFTSKYAYQNGSCLDSCPAPFKRADNPVRYCVRPCNDPGAAYKEETGTCVYDCDLPFEIVTIDPGSTEPVKACRRKYSNNDLSQSGTAADLMNITQPIALAVVTSRISSSAFGASAFGYVVLDKFLYYLRYMKIDYPPRVVLFFISNNAPINLDFGIPEPSYLRENINQYEVPYQYAKYGISSSFTLNYWDTLSVLALIFAITIVLNIVAKLLDRKRTMTIKNIILTLRQVVRWNLLLLVFCSSYDQITLFTYLEVRHLELTQPINIVDFILSILSVIMAIFVLVTCIYLVRTYQKLKKQIVPAGRSGLESMRQFILKWESYKVLYSGYKDYSFITQSFLLFFIGRSILFNLIIIGFYDYPIVQATMITILSILMVTYIFKTKPFVQKSGIIELVLLESIVLVANISVLVLAILDTWPDEYLEKKALFGDIMLYATVSFTLVSIVFMFVEMIEKLIELYKAVKVYKGNWKIALFQLILVPFQTGGMDYGEIERRFLEKLIRKRESRLIPEKNEKKDKTEKKSNIWKKIKISMNAFKSKPKSNKVVPEIRVAPPKDSDVIISSENELNAETYQTNQSTPEKSTNRLLFVNQTIQQNSIVIIDDVPSLDTEPSTKRRLDVSSRSFGKSRIPSKYQFRGLLSSQELSEVPISPLYNKDGILKNPRSFIRDFLSSQHETSEVKNLDGSIEIKKRNSEFETKKGGIISEDPTFGNISIGE